MLFCLLAWPSIISLRSLEALLDNALLLDGHEQLLTLTMVNFIAVVFCIGIVRLLNRRFPTKDLLAGFGDGASAWTPKLFFASVAIAAVTPSVLAWTSRREFSHGPFWHVLCSIAVITLGVGLAWLFLVAVGWVKALLFGNSPDSENYLPFEFSSNGVAVLKRSLVARIGKVISLVSVKFGFEQIDLLFAGYLALLAVIHWISVRFLAATEVHFTSMPLLVVLLIWLVFMLLAGAANLLDRLRLPVVPLLLLAITIWQIPRGSTMPLKTVAADSGLNFFNIVSETNASQPHDFASTGQLTSVFEDSVGELNQFACSAINHRLQHVIEKRRKLLPPEKVAAADERGRTLVVVTCPGGGIHAAAWASCVLDSISHEYSDFADSVCVISGVSGGSVGTLYFASSRYHSAISQRQETDQADRANWDRRRDSGTASAYDGDDPVLAAVYDRAPSLLPASRSALEPIAYGLMTDDLYGMICSALAFNDRGQRLEDVFHNNLPAGQADITLGHWGDVALAGNMPIVIFNSTDAATGRRILFDSVPTPRRIANVGQKSRPLNYRELMGRPDGQYRDVRPSSAVRASATFPYISPFARPDHASTVGKAVVMCDGGYVDNEGIVTAVNWIEFCLARMESNMPSGTSGGLTTCRVEGSAESIKFDRVLLLRIEPNPNTSDGTTGPSVNAEGIESWLRWLTGPIEAVVNVRSTSQYERGNLEADLLYSSEKEQRQANAENATASNSTGQTASQPPALMGKALVKKTLTIAKKKTVEGSKTSGQKKSGQEKQSNSGDQTRSTAQMRNRWQRKTMELRAEISAYLKKLGNTGSNQSNPAANPSPFMEGYSVEEDAASETTGYGFDLEKDKLVVVRVQFPDFNQAVPLNWKLSKAQKLWYPLAWRICSGKNSTLRKTLDAFFTPALEQ